MCDVMHEDHNFQYQKVWLYQYYDSTIGSIIAIYLGSILLCIKKAKNFSIDIWAIHR